MKNKRYIKKQFLKGIAVILSVLMIFTVIPSVVTLAESDLAAADETTVDSSESITLEPQIVGEIVEKRELDTKYFLLNDGSILAAKYDKPVHYYDEDGKFQNVDNSLLEKNDSETGEAVLENQKNSYKVKFSKKSKNSKLVSISKGNYKMDWALSDANKVSAQYINYSGEEETDPTILKNLTSTVEYKDIMQSVDINYVSDACGVKENIILNDNTAPSSFEFTYKINGLEYRTDTQGNIELFDPALPEEIVFIIEKPYMYDANKYYSEDIEMLITDTNKGFKITLIPDSEWLNSEERAYPIVIDPSTFSSTVRSDIWDISMMQGQIETISCNDADLLVGVDSTGQLYRSVIKFNGLPPLRDSDIVISAIMNITAYQSVYNGVSVRPRPSGNPIVNIHRVNASWPETTDWNTTADDYDPIVSDYFVYNTTSTNFQADITDIVAGWYNGTYQDYGVMLKSADESTTNRLMQFTSSDWGNSEAHETYRPLLAINYRNTTGLEDYWSYTSQDFGAYGTGYVNNYNGNLVYAHNDFTFNSGISPFTLSHVFNTSETTEKQRNGKTSGFYGVGWRLNMVQRVQYVDVAKDDDTVDMRLEYTDGDGTRHYFVEQDDGTTVDEDGLGFTYTAVTEAIDNNQTAIRHRITDKNGNVMMFDQNGDLRRILDTNGNMVNMYYAVTSNSIPYLAHVTSLSGGMVFLSYNSNMLLSAVTDEANRVTSFGYTSSGQLTSITYPDGTKVEFAYNQNNLISVTAPDGSKIIYGFNKAAGKVKTVENYGKNATLGGKLTFTYSLNQTEVVDSKNRKITYQFDSWGRPTCVYDNHQNIYNQSYTPTVTSGSGIFANNKPASSSNGSVYVNNLLTNGVFSSDLSSWIKYNPNSYPFEIVTNQSLLTSKSVRITNNASGTTALMQPIAGTAGKTYTMSGYLKTADVVSSDWGAAVEVITSKDNRYYSDFLIGTTDSEIDNGFERVSVTFTLAADEIINRVSAGLYNASGTVYIDSLQLEEGDSANAINLVSNSSFEKNSGNGTIPTGFTSSVASGQGGANNSNKKDGSYSLSFIANSKEYRSARQTVEVSGKAGEVYTLGGWAKANSAPKHTSGNSPNFIITMNVHYTDGTSEWMSCPLNVHVSAWQYTSKTHLMKKDYTKIEVSCSYDYNCNTVYFDNIFLYRDTMQSYTYDKDGNVISTLDYAKQESDFQYSGNNLSSLINPDGSGYEYIYDSKNNLIATRSSEGLQYDITYSTQGNPTKTLIGKNKNSSSLISGDVYMIRNKNSGKYLTAESASNSANVSQNHFNGTTAQQWRIVKNTDGSFTLKSMLNESYLLDVAGGASADGTNVRLGNSTDNTSKHFKLLINGDFTYQILTSASSYKSCVEVVNASTSAGANVAQKAYTEGNGQKWYFENIEQEPVSAIESGAVYMLRARHSGKCIDLTNGATDTGTVAYQYENNFSDSQKFIINRYGTTDYYTLTSYKAGDKLLEISTEKNSIGYRFLRLGDSTVNDNKLFKLEYYSAMQGFYIIPKVAENLSLDVNGYNAANGTALIFTGKAANVNRFFLPDKVSEFITSSATYQDNGNYPHTVTDSRGNTTTYEYNFSKGLQTAVTDAKGNETEYNYNSLNDRLESVVSGGKTVSYEYETNGAIKKITSPGGTQYNFAYDEFGRSTQISVGNQALSTTEYQDNYSALVKKFIYGNGVYKEYTYDDLDRIISESINGTVSRTYLYDKLNNTSKVNDILAGVTTELAYDLIGRIYRIKSSDGQSLRLDYDALNRVSLSKWSLGDMAYSTGYIYGDNSVAGQKAGLIYGVKLNNSQKLSYAYDDLTRMLSRTVNTTTPFITEYTYHSGAAYGTTTTLVKTVKNGNDILEYSYDELGNITSVKKNNVVIESYAYDSLNQLVSATNGGEIYTYTYDNGGNILSVAENGEVIKSYTYGNAEWKDLLTNFNGQSITYDEIGNPINYRNGYSFTWANGRRLTSVSQNSTALASYTYNADGLRTSKTVNGTTTEYYWLNGILQGQKTGNEYIIFLYDENGSAYGFLVNNGVSEAYYYYVFNLQGDVIGIIDSSGASVVEYTYGAWGDILSVTGTLANTIGQQNPIRYRGYYYDGETQFYYLQSRYYDPITQRFLNADGYVSTGQGILATNMFAYCGNNPINYVDPTGKFFEAVRKIVNTIIKKAKDLIDNILNSITPSHVSNELVKFLIEYERFEPVPYDDGYGNMTIGYGHTIKSGEHFDSITMDEAFALFKKDLSTFESMVTKYSAHIKIRWDQNEYDAFVSLAYNSGNNFKDVMDLIVSGHDPIEAFSTIVYSNGQFSLGLQRRRLNEANIFTKGIYERTY